MQLRSHALIMSEVSHDVLLHYRVQEITDIVYKYSGIICNINVDVTLYNLCFVC